MRAQRFSICKFKFASWISSTTLLLLPCMLPAGNAAGVQETPLTPVYRDVHANPDQRITDLLARMTLDEKIHALSTDPSVPRLGIAGSTHVEGLHGLALGGP